MRKNWYLRKKVVSLLRFYFLFIVVAFLWQSRELVKQTKLKLIWRFITLHYSSSNSNHCQRWRHINWHARWRGSYASVPLQSRLLKPGVHLLLGPKLTPLWKRGCRRKIFEFHLQVSNDAQLSTNRLWNEWVEEIFPVMSITSGKRRCHYSNDSPTTLNSIIFMFFSSFASQASTFP